MNKEKAKNNNKRWFFWHSRHCFCCNKEISSGFKIGTDPFGNWDNGPLVCGECWDKYR